MLCVAAADHTLGELVVQALGQAVFTRKFDYTGMIFHPDRDSQFTPRAVVKACNELGLIRSLGTMGSCYDYSRAESFR